MDMWKLRMLPQRRKDSGIQVIRPGFVELIGQETRESQCFLKSGPNYTRAPEMA